MDFKYKREYIMAVGERSEVTDCMTGVRCALFGCESRNYFFVFYEK